MLFYTEEDTILRFVEFHLHGLRYVAEYIRTDTCIADNTMDFSRGMFQESLKSFERSGISIHFHDTSSFLGIISYLFFFFVLIIIIFFCHLIDMRIHSAISMRYIYKQ